MNYPTNNDDVIDSRDVIEVIAVLGVEDELDEDETNDLAALVALADNGEDYSDDWQYGATLVRDSYFEDYAQELCEDCGDAPDFDDLPWYISDGVTVDWGIIARNIQMDYTSVDFDGVTYWVR